MNDNLLRLLRRKNDASDTRMVSMDDDALVIDCRSCTYAPEPASKECFRCMVDSMSCIGGADRIIMRAGKDIEVSGKSGEAIRKLASLKKWSIPMKDTSKDCRRCDRSRRDIFSSLWEGFPDMDFGSAIKTLETGDFKDGCSDCVRSSRRALEQLRCDIDSVNDLLKVRL